MTLFPPFNGWPGKKKPDESEKIYPGYLLSKALVPKFNMTVEFMVDPGMDTFSEVTHGKSKSGQPCIMPDVCDKLRKMVIHNGGKVETFVRGRLGTRELHDLNSTVDIFMPDTKHWPDSILALIDYEAVARLRDVFKTAFAAVPEVSYLIDKCQTQDDFARLMRQALRIAANSPHIKLKDS